MRDWACYNKPSFEAVSVIYLGREKVGKDDKFDPICELIFILLIMFPVDRGTGCGGLYHWCEMA